MLLKVGSRGNDVKNLQYGLHIINYSAGVVDGIFGSKGLVAVKNFQRANGLAVDGIVGDDTWNRLISKIRPIEEALSKKGFAVDRIDGVATSTTYNAVLNFQRANNLSADGIVGANTMRALNATNTGVNNKKKIFIDPGHGGTDSGAIGNNLQEKNIVLSIALKLGAILERNGFTVYYSRQSDVFLSLQERVNKSNSAGVDLFISIHSNAFNAQSNGTESFTRSSAVNSVKNLSRNIAGAISSKLGITNRGHKEANFVVIKNTNMPSLLVETAFITNYNDAMKLRDKQNEFADIIADEIIKFFN